MKLFISAFRAHPTRSIACRATSDDNLTLAAFRSGRNFSLFIPSLRPRLQDHECRAYARARRDIFSSNPISPGGHFTTLPHTRRIIRALHSAIASLPIICSALDSIAYLVINGQPCCIIGSGRPAFRNIVRGPWVALSSRGKGMTLDAVDVNGYTRYGGVNATVTYRHNACAVCSSPHRVAPRCACVRVHVCARRSITHAASSTPLLTITLRFMSRA